MNKYASKGGVAFYYLPCSCNRCKLLVKSSRNSGLRSKHIQMAQNAIHQGLRNHTSIQGIFYDVFFGDLGGTKYNVNFAHCEHNFTYTSQLQKESITFVRTQLQAPFWTLKQEVLRRYFVSEQFFSSLWYHYTKNPRVMVYS